MDELTAFLGEATHRGYIVEKALRRIIAEHKAFQQRRSRQGDTGARLGFA